MQELERDDVSNIHRRYSLLFTIPSLPKTIALCSLITVPLILLINGTQTALLTVPLFQALLYLFILLEVIALRSNPLKSLRRMIFLSAITNGIWLMLSLPALLTYDPGKLTTTLLFGMFVAIAFRTLVFRATSFDSMLRTLLLSATQPVLIALPILLSFNIPQTTRLVYSYAAGGAILLSVSLYLEGMDRLAKPKIKFTPLRLLKAFLEAWTAEKPEAFEGIAEYLSSTETVRTHSINFRGDDTNVILLIPEVHPGPFYPVGSSNLPLQIFEHLQRKKYAAMIFHGVSGHDLNLASKIEVNKLLESIHKPSFSQMATTFRPPIIASHGRATTVGMALENTAIVILSMSPFGMDDIPRLVRHEIQRYALTLGFTHLIAVDAHNSIGKKPTDQNIQELLVASKELLHKMSSSKRLHAQVGFAHSQDLGFNLNYDVGHAGIGVLVFQFNESDRYFLVSVDANNMIKGLREKIIDHFQRKKVNIIEVCTSDSHATAGKTRNENGYLAFGDISTSSEIIAGLERLIDKAVQNLSQKTCDISYVDTEFKVFGTSLLRNFSDLIDSSLRIAKVGGFIISVLVISIITANLIF